MTLQRKDSEGTPFGLWLRQQQEIDSRRCGLSIQNLDYIIHMYGDVSCQKIMLIEEKRYNGKQSFAQKDTHSIIDQSLTHANGKLVRTTRGLVVKLHYFGYHLLTFENTTPEDGRMWWDGILITESTLLSMLRFETSPFLKR